MFGSLILMLLGVMIRYGLNYDFQQQATMEAFRRSLANAPQSGSQGTPIAMTHMLIQDRWMPDPANPFSKGTTVPIAGQAGVTRSNQLQVVPETPEELPRIAIQVKDGRCPGGARIPSDVRDGQTTCYYTTADFRQEFPVPQGSLDRYKFVFGAGSVCDEPKCGGSRQACLRSEEGQNRETGEPENVCVEYAMFLKILDPCMGEIINRDDCIRQVRQMTDSAACQAACEKSSRTDCAAICSQPMSPNLPWYAAPGALDAVFAERPSLGVQPGTKIVVQNNTLRKQETPSVIQTTATVDTTETINRPIAWIASGTGGTAATGTMTAERRDESTTSWSSSW